MAGEGPRPQPEPADEPPLPQLVRVPFPGPIDFEEAPHDRAWPGYWSEAEQRAAHRATANAVRAGRLPPVQTLACRQCGVPGQRPGPKEPLVGLTGQVHYRQTFFRNVRLVYHHRRGYDLAHAEDVEPLCIPCHCREHDRLDRPL
jgi:hypothetical protein